MIVIGQTPIRDELEEAPAGDGWAALGSEMGARVQLRAGLHCGPVSGRVVGSRAFKYTLMGDAVSESVG